MKALQSASSRDVPPSHNTFREMFERVIVVAQILKNHADSAPFDKVDEEKRGEKTQDHKADIP